MIHNVKEKKLGRDAAHRKALLRNLSDSLIINKNVQTTLAKAKYLRPYIEKLITKAKKGNDFNNFKYVTKKLSTNKAARLLLSEVAPKYIDRKGGYIRITKLPERDGDKAKMARVELV
jgi:large subunit ribosomal protein L17